MSVPVITAALRTPVGTAGGALADLDVVALGAPVVARLAADVDDPVEELVLGNCLGPGGDPARSVALAAGLGVGVPALTVDRQCGSGLEAVALAATAVRADEARLVLAGGVESASTAPWRSWPPVGDAPPQRYTRAPFAPPGFPDPSMGEAADALAAVHGITREAQDAWAARSHRLAHATREAGGFDAETVALPGLHRDQRPRPGLTVERLARLRPAFSPAGTATAGNACGISDGAAVVTVAAGGSGLAVRGVARAAGDPALPGDAAAAATRLLLSRHPGVGADDLGAVEVTEAFASVALAFVAATGVDPEVVCSDGGAIGYGHPWGASGAVLLVRLFSRMVRRDGPQLGLAACAIGGGQGIAVLVERV